MLCDTTNVLKQQVVFSDMMTAADRCSVLLCTVLVWLAVCSPGLVLDLSPHWGQEESPDEADWSQYEVMHCLQNQCPQLVETGSFRTSWHKAQQDGCSSTETWLLFLSLWRHFFRTKIICWLLLKSIQICPTLSGSSDGHREKSKCRYFSVWIQDSVCNENDCSFDFNSPALINTNELLFLSGCLIKHLVICL